MSDGKADEKWNVKILWIVIGIILTGVVGEVVTNIIKRIEKPSLLIRVDPAFLEDGTYGLRGFNPDNFLTPKYHTDINITNNSNAKAESVSIEISIGESEFKPLPTKYAGVILDDSCVQKESFSKKESYFSGIIDCHDLRIGESKKIDLYFYPPPERLTLGVGYSDFYKKTAYKIVPDGVDYLGKTTQLKFILE